MINFCEFSVGQKKKNNIVKSIHISVRPESKIKNFHLYELNYIRNYKQILIG